MVGDDQLDDPLLDAEQPDPVGRHQLRLLDHEPAEQAHAVGVARQLVAQIGEHLEQVPQRWRRDRPARQQRLDPVHELGGVLGKNRFLTRVVVKVSAMAMLLYRLGHFSVRHRRLVVAFWGVALIGAAGLSAGLGGQTTNAFTLPGTESQEAFDLLDERFPTQGGTFTRVVVAGDTLDDSAVSEAMATAFEEAGEVPGVSLATPPAPGATSADGRIAFGEVRYPVGPFDVEEETSDAVGEAFADLDEQGVRVEFGGEACPAERPSRPRRRPSACCSPW